MSTHRLTAKDPKHEILVGWDPMLRSYFAHVIDTTIDEDDWKRDVVWLGATPGEVLHVMVIIAVLLPYAEIPESLARDLEEDAWNGSK